ncbi:MAG: transporter, ATPase subunit [Acidobacteria bacterium]|jgi:ATP-binding cassette, subfamily B, multidrug efflux pump|nr:transporter, ATPase subunit [Acidobacteriota bacterium]
MNVKKYPLLFLIPYLGRYRLKIGMGFVMVVCTVAAATCQPWVLKYVVDGLQQSLNKEKLLSYAGMILGLSAIEGFFRFWMRKILIGVSRDIEYDLRNDFLAHVQKMSMSFLQSRSTGDIMSRATNDLNAVRSVLGPGIMYSMNTIVLVIISTYILLQLNWKLTLLAYIPLVIMSFAVKRVGGEIHDRFESIQEQFSSLSTKAQENISGIRVVKAFAREESEVAEFRKLNADYVRRNVSLIRLWGLFYPLMTALIGLSSVALLWFGGRQVISEHLTLGEFVAFMGYLAMLTWPTIAVGWVLNIFQRGAASMGRMLEIMDAPPDIHDVPGAAAPATVHGALEFRNLTFQYPNSRNPVLHDVSVSVPAGTTLAIVGHTGSGKSTLINLIPRLFDPPPGTLFLDGKDVRQWPLPELRKNIGYVPQETFLFSDTIHQNIAFGCDETIKTDQVDWAARVSQMAGDIETFSDKMQTYLGERGITLSGGQKQRVAISRAIATLPKILIFDDSLSNVDTYTEERILEELTKVMKSRTTILVSHRISTVKNAQQIVVLKDGSIVEHGTHESLMELQGVYADLYQKQLLEEELATI